MGSHGRRKKMVFACSYAVLQRTIGTPPTDEKVGRNTNDTVGRRKKYKHYYYTTRGSTRGRRSCHSSKGAERLEHGGGGDTNGTAEGGRDCAKKPGPAT